MSGYPEVLVHVSAPTTKRKDDVYHSLAEAYIGFEPIVEKRTQSEPSIHEPECLQPIASSRADESGLSTTSKDSFGSFPSYSESRDQYDTQDDSSRPRSRLDQLERIQSIWRERRTPRPSLNEARLSTSGADLFVEDTQQAFQLLESQLPEYLSTLEDTSEDGSESGMERPPLMASAGNAQTESPGGLDDKGERLASSFDKSFEANVTTSPHFFPPPTSKETQPSSIRTRTRATSSRFRNLPYEIFPPPPQVTVESPGAFPSQITKFLETLKLQNSSRFRPSSQLRTLVQDERGYWFVECSTWPVDHQYEFWTSLSDHIRSGRLGWGVTLHRESGQSQRLGTIRLYSWGEIAEHIWLLLWLCSKGSIAISSSRWVDADDIVVVEMS